MMTSPGWFRGWGSGPLLVAASLLWHGGGRSPTDKPRRRPTPRWRPAAGRRSDPPDRRLPRRRLGRDAGEQRLRPRSRSATTRATDRLYRIEFATAGEAAAARAKLAHDPSVESVDFDALASHPARRRGRRWRSPPPRRAWRPNAARRRRPAAAFPNDACFKYQWHLRQLGMPDAWKRGNGKGVIVAVIDTGVSKVADLAETKFVAGLQLRRQQRQRRRRPRPRHARRRHDRAVDQQQASASPASPTARRSCRSRCCRRAARARSPASPRPSARPPTTAPRSST